MVVFGRRDDKTIGRHYPFLQCGNRGRNTALILVVAVVEGDAFHGRNLDLDTLRGKFPGRPQQSEVEGTLPEAAWQGNYLFHWKYSSRINV